MTRCPNLSNASVLNDFNAIIKRLGGKALTATDVVPRQPYLASLREQELQAYHVAHYLWNEHPDMAAIVEFLNALDALRGKL